MAWQLWLNLTIAACLNSLLCRKSNICVSQSLWTEPCNYSFTIVWWVNGPFPFHELNVTYSTWWKVCTKHHAITAEFHSKNIVFMRMLFRPPNTHGWSLSKQFDLVSFVLATSHSSRTFQAHPCTHGPISDEFPYAVLTADYFREDFWEFKFFRSI